jgi:hypothetical protein
LRDGVIADIDVAEEMIKHFIRKVHGKPRMFRYPGNRDLRSLGIDFGRTSRDSRRGLQRRRKRRST